MKLITTNDMVKLTRYAKSTISNWKKRYTDFPRPIEVYERTELYDPLEFSKWLEMHEARKRK